VGAPECPGGPRTSHYVRDVLRLQGPASTLALLLLLAGGPGCTRDRLQSEWELTVEQLAGEPATIVDMLPAEATTGVGHRVDPYVLFNRPLNDEEIDLFDVAQVTEQGGGGVVGSPLLDEDGSGVSLQLPDLARDEAYQVAWVPPLPEADGALRWGFDTNAPGGLAYNMSAYLDVESFGGEPSHADLLDEQFEPGVYPLWILQLLGAPAVLDGQPWRADLVFAPARWEPNEELEWFVRREYGYVGWLADVVVDGTGRIDHRQEGLFLPLWSSWDVVLLYLVDVELQGQVEQSGDEILFTELRLSGVLGTRWLLRLAAGGGGWAEAVNVLQPDIDTNGNGRNDAATFSFTSRPRPVDPVEIDL
jgi:hypothetical protein